MDRQSFTLKQTAIGGVVLLEIPRNHLVCCGRHLCGVYIPISTHVKMSLVQATQTAVFYPLSLQLEQSFSMNKVFKSELVTGLKLTLSHARPNVTVLREPTDILNICKQTCIKFIK